MKRWKPIVISILAAAILEGSLSCGDSQAAELNDGWAPYKTNNPACKAQGISSEVNGDFDGNGKPDVAKLQTNSSSRKYRLAVWMNGESRPQVIREWDKENVDYLNLQRPGVYTPFVDVLEDYQQINIEFDSVAIGRCGYPESNTIYLWDRTTKKFREPIPDQKAAERAEQSGKTCALKKRALCPKGKVDGCQDGSTKVHKCIPIKL